jgi:hypothetical protein
MECLRSNVALNALINPESLGLNVVSPSLATGLVDTIAVAVDFQTRSLVTPFQGDFAIADMLRLASGFGLDLNSGGPQPYEEHDVWDIDALGLVLAIAEADETTGVAASGRGVTAIEARALAEASLDCFDGRSAGLLSAPGLVDLVSDVPSGFAALVLAECERLPLFADAQGLPGCTAAVVTAAVLRNDLIVIHALMGFADQNQALADMRQATERWRTRSGPMGSQTWERARKGRT